jgi:hypothetical protein
MISHRTFAEAPKTQHLVWLFSVTYAPVPIQKSGITHALNYIPSFSFPVAEDCPCSGHLVTPFSTLPFLGDHLMYLDQGWKNDPMDHIQLHAQPLAFPWYAQ